MQTKRVNIFSCVSVRFYFIRPASSEWQTEMVNISSCYFHVSTKCERFILSVLCSSDAFFALIFGYDAISRPQMTMRSVECWMSNVEFPSWTKKKSVNLFLAIGVCGDRVGKGNEREQTKKKIAFSDKTNYSLIHYASKAVRPFAANGCVSCATWASFILSDRRLFLSPSSSLFRCFLRLFCIDSFICLFFVRRIRRFFHVFLLFYFCFSFFERRSSLLR